MTRSLITVFPGSRVWLVRFHDDPEVMRLFGGTDTVGSGYMLAAPAAEVWAAVRAKNPAARVRLVDRDGFLYDPEDADDRPTLSPPPEEVL